MELTEELKKRIDDMPYIEMLRKNRFDPCGEPIFAGESGQYFLKIMAEKRAADPAGAVAASKAIGW